MVPSPGCEGGNFSATVSKIGTGDLLVWETDNFQGQK